MEVREVEGWDETKRSFHFFINNHKVGSLRLDLKEGDIYGRLNEYIECIFGIDIDGDNTDAYFIYTNFLNKLGFNVNLKVDSKHWIPRLHEVYYCYSISSNDVILNINQGDGVNKDLISNYHAFPTKELVLRGRNMSKIGRLQLLYQYKNNLLVDNTQIKDYREYVTLAWCKSTGVHSSRADNLDTRSIYWSNKEDLDLFIKFYEKEIMEFMKERGIK